MNNWTLDLVKDFKPVKPIFIEGLPGIGNVGKVAVDYLIDTLKAEKVGDFFSTDLPAQVFINEENLVVAPSLSLYYINIKDQDYIFLRGEFQPVDDKATYAFTNFILSKLKDWSCTQVIATGGVGLPTLPETPTIYVTGSCADLVSSFVEFGANKDVFGLIGTIMGVSGLLVGLSSNYDLPSAALLIETSVLPTHVSLRESRQLIDFIANKCSLEIDFAEFDEEIAYVEEELSQLTDGVEDSDKKPSKYKKLMKGKDLNYIG